MATPELVLVSHNWHDFDFVTRCYISNRMTKTPSSAAIVCVFPGAAALQFS